MFLNKYLDNFYYDMLYDNYDSSEWKNNDKSNQKDTYRYYEDYG